MPVWVYILHCSDDTLYTGITWNITKRLSEHERGLTPFTKNRLPVILLYTEKFSSRVDAARKEKEIKGWSRSKKLAYIDRSSLR